MGDVPEFILQFESPEIRDELLSKLRGLEQIRQNPNRQPPAGQDAAHVKAEYDKMREFQEAANNLGVDLPGTAWGALVDALEGFAQIQYAIQAVKR